MSETPNDILAALREAQASDPVVAEFAWVWLEDFRRDAQEILQRHRREGRAVAERGEDPAAVRDRTEEQLEKARQRLLGRLQRLMAWARESGREDQSN